MIPYYRLLFLLLLVTGLGFGCSGTSNPSAPPITGTPARESTDDYGGSHTPWLFRLVYIDASDPGNISNEIVPVRLADDHWNILNFLENFPCDDCLKINNISPSGSGTLLVDIEISHPFESANFTGFDVRGIAMFDSSEAFPFPMVTYSDRYSGAGEVVNPDGFTRLYHKWTAGMGPGGLQGYLDGRFSTLKIPDATLNAYKRFITDDVSNTRNAFYAGDSIEVTYEIAMPSSEFVFGYAVDACWRPAVHKPVTDPMVDFDEYANCPEPWKTEVSQNDVGPGFTEAGGTTIISIDVYDYFGTDFHIQPTFYCQPFTQEIMKATLKAEYDDHSHYEVVLDNFNLEPEGLYSYLVIVTSMQDDPDLYPWLDLTAYYFGRVNVLGTDVVAVADAEPNPEVINQPVHFSDDGSFDPDGGTIVNWEWDWDNDGTYDAVGQEADHSWSEPGIKHVQLRVTDDSGQSGELVNPLWVAIEPGLPWTMEDLTPDWSGFRPRDVAITGDHALVAGGSSGVQVYDISDPLHITWEPILEIPESAYNVSTDGGYAYVSASDNNYFIIDIDPFQDAAIIKTLEATGRSEILGGYAYVLGTENLAVIDIDPPETAYVVCYIPMPYFSRDIKISGGYAFVPTWHDGLLVIDVDPPADTSIVTNYDDTHGWDTIGIAGDTAYAFDGYEYLYVLDISSPETPSEVSSYPVINGYDRMEIEGDYMYAGGYDNFDIFDISDPGDIFITGTVEAFTDSFCLDDGYAYVVMSGYRFQVIDIDPPDAPVLEYWIGTQYSNAVAVQDSENVYMLGQLKGLQVLDCDPVDQTHTVAQVDIGNGGKDAVYRDGYVYVADAYHGMYIIDVDPPESTFISDDLSLPCAAYDIELLENHALLANTSDGLAIVELTSPGTGTLFNTIPLPGNARGVAVGGGYAYVAAYDGGLQIVDIDPIESTHLVNWVETFDEAVAVSYTDGYVAVGTYNFDYPLLVIDVEPVEASHIVHMLDAYSPGGSGNIVFTGGGGCALSCDTSYIRVVDFAPPEQACVVNSVFASPDSIAVIDNMAYVAASIGWLRIFKLWG